MVSSGVARVGQIRRSKWAKSGLFRTLDATSRSRPRDSRSRRQVRQDASAEELKPGAAIHLTVDGLESVNLALHLSGAPRGVHGCGDSGDVFLQPVGEADH